MPRRGSFWGQDSESSLPQELLGRPRDIEHCRKRLKIDTRLEQRICTEDFLHAYYGESPLFKMRTDPEAPGGRVYTCLKTKEIHIVCSSPDSIDDCEKILNTEPRPRHRRYLEKLKEELKSAENDRIISIR